ncbi:Plant self-incompatibility protein S1 [Sesbania bispinosa]|nr:Plant self-incompatibility protein S1 [Sesbania bispinosa]
MGGLARMTHLMSLLLVMGLCTFVVEGTKHVSIKNKLGSGKNLTLHCQSKDNDLGEQNIADGDQFGWDFNDNIIETTLFFCDLSWEKAQGYHFDAYSSGRDFIRCHTGCSWLVSVEGIYILNGQTGLWEFIYNWQTE